MQPMDEQILITMDEKVTAPGLSAVDQKRVDGNGAGSVALIEAIAVTEQPPRSGFLGAAKNFFRGYGSALVMSLPILPIVVSAITIGIYLSNPNASGWVSIVYGAASTYIAWLLISLFLIPLSATRAANSRSYGLLDSRLNQLESRLRIIQQQTNGGQNLAQYQQVALNEAFDKLEEISKDLYTSHSRLSWVLGYGYVNAWGKLHRAEEALVEVEPVEIVMRGAMHDKLAISGSQISNREELLAKLLYAVKRLDPLMANLFKPYVSAVQGENESADVQQLEQDVQKIAHHLHMDLGDHAAKSQTTRDTHDAEDPARARLTLREVRCSLNDYRDHLWEGVVRARNNLLGTTFVTGLVTHVLLCVAILAMTPAAGSTGNDRSAIVAATAYYMLGAIAGLFGRIGQATIANIAVDDYGLSLAQMISRPLYSGLAGLGGVLVSSTILSISTQNGLNLIQGIFTLNRPDFLIVAAAFGLAPNLIASGLQNQTNKFLSALRSSKTTTADTNTGASANGGQSSGD